MSTTTILAVGAAATLGTALIPAAVAVVASPINRARDARHHAAETAHDNARTADLAAQIRAGVEYAALVDPDPGKLSAAAYAAAAGLAVWFDREGHPEGAPLIRRVLDELNPMLTAAQVPVPAVYAAPPITGAAALQLLLHHLYEASGGPARARVSIAAGAAVEAIRAIPDGCVVDFNPLTEHDPEPLRRAQAEWVAAAQSAGLPGWTRAIRV